MRVAMYYSNNDVRCEEMPVPKIGPGEVLVKVKASGICGSDCLEWYRLQSAPKVLGHEITGDVDKVGEGGENFKRGDRVFVSHHVPCNTCHYCVNDNHTVCETLHTTNFDPGGFAEYVRVPRINVDRGTFLLPDDLSYDDGVFIEPVACVVRGQRKAGIALGQTVLILGSGFSGLLHLVLAKASGVTRVICTDVSDYRLGMATKLGANAAIQAKDYTPAKLKEVNAGRLADLVIVCTGAPTAFEQALKSVDRGGTILCFATTEPDVKLEVPLNEFWRNGITIMPSYAGAPADIRIAIELLRAGVFPTKELTTHEFPLESCSEGFRLVSEAGESMKVVLKP